MYTAELAFGIMTRRDDEAGAEGVNKVVVALQRNGQVLSDEWPIARTREAIRTFVSIPERGSLHRKHENKWVKQAQRELPSAGLSAARFTVLGPEPDSLALCRCRRRSSFVLYTHYLSMECPLRCADCLNPVPFYEIPHTSDCATYEDIIFWRRDYQRCDELQMHCTVGERFCTAQMSRLDSALNRTGLACRQSVEKVTRKPCYYYLYRYGGKSRRHETQRRCAQCGGEWLQTEPWHGKFDFRCDRCRLISNISFSVG